MRRRDSLLILKNACLHRNSTSTVALPPAGDTSDLIVDWPDKTSSRNGAQLLSEKSVQFSNRCVVHLIPDSRENPEETWLSPRERTTMKKRTKEVVRAMRRTNSEAELMACTGDSSRGLEHLNSRTFTETLKKHVEELVYAVLLAQEQQRQTGSHDEHTIAAASCEVSKWARDRAVSLGASDAAAVAALKFENFTDSCPSGNSMAGNRSDAFVNTPARPYRRRSIGCTAPCRSASLNSIASMESPHHHSITNQPLCNKTFQDSVGPKKINLSAASAGRAQLGFSKPSTNKPSGSFFSRSSSDGSF